MSNPKHVIDTAEAMSQTLEKVVVDSQAVLKQSLKDLEGRIMTDMAALKVSPNGGLVGPRTNLKQAQAVHKKLAAQFEEAYGAGVRRAVKGFNVVAQEIMDSWPDLQSAIKYTGVDRTMMETLASQAVAEFERFGAQAQERIASAMYGQVVARAPYSDLVAEMATILGTGVDVRGNSMARYADLWANDSIMNFHQDVTLKKAGDAGLTSFLYYGNVIKTSRSFCIDRAGKTYSRKQIESWDNITWRGKAGPPLTYRGGWNCRHHWHPIKDEWVPDGSIQTGDYYSERGIDIARGNTVPAWPGAGPATPKPVADRPKDLAEPYKDPHNRWVPWENPHSKEADDWVNQVFKDGEDFNTWAGMGPCAPVADNIVQVLNAQGRKARVMYTHYAPIGPAGEMEASRAFAHYVAVELDEYDRVFRIYDPTNPYNKGIHNIKPGGPLPKDYFPEGTWVRKRPQDADRAIGILESEDAPHVASMRKVVDTPAQHRIYYGRPDVSDDWVDYRAGAGYDINTDLDEYIVRSLGELSPGASSRVLFDMADDAYRTDKIFIVHADDIPRGLTATRGMGDDGAAYLEDLGMAKDIRRGEGWYFAEREDLQRARWRIDKDVEKAMPTVGDDWRDTADIFADGVYEFNGGDMYTLTEHQWWYGKLTRPGTAFAVPDEGWGWTYMADKKAAKAQLEELTAIVDNAGGYPTIDQGIYAGRFRWRHNHGADSYLVTAKANPIQLEEAFHGKLQLGRVSSNTINAMGDRFAELQTRTQQLKIPVMRGLNSTGAVRGNIGGAMGDGVLTLNPRDFEKAFGGSTFNIANYRTEVKRFIDDAEPVLVAIGKAEGKGAATYRVLKEQIDGRRAELRRLDDDNWIAPKYGSDTRQQSKFVPDQEGVEIPFSVHEYLPTTVERVHDLMEHEFAHHIHQRLFLKVASQQSNPPLEKWLNQQFRLLHIKGANQRNVVSGYSQKNAHEWFAENYAMWRQGRKGWVRPELRGLMEGLDELEAGTITEKELFDRLFSGGNLSTGQWDNYLMPLVKGKYAEPVVDDAIDRNAKALRYVAESKSKGRTLGDVQAWLVNHGIPDATEAVAKDWMYKFSVEGRVFLYDGRYFTKSEIFNKTGAIYMPKPGESAVKFKPGG